MLFADVFDTKIVHDSYQNSNNCTVTTSLEIIFFNFIFDFGDLKLIWTIWPRAKLGDARMGRYRSNQGPTTNPTAESYSEFLCEHDKVGGVRGEALGIEH